MSEDFGSTAWIPYNQRPEWSDVKGIPQDEGPNPVARIAYSDKFTDVFDYFRAVVASGEVSDRALNLTKDAVELNPANYSVWHHRRWLLKELNTNLVEEMAYCRAVIEDHPKNYQVWQHRRALVEWTKDPSKELLFTKIILNMDAKNYHAWQHRQWAIQTFQLFDDELIFINGLLESDVRNNSAWNQRFFVITSTKNENLKSSGGGGPVLSGTLLEEEIDFTCKAIVEVPGNESAWNYLRGLIEHSEESLVGPLKQKITTFCEEILKENGDSKSPKAGGHSPYLMAMLVDLYRDSGDTDDVNKAHQLCKDLAEKHDTIRREYWEFTASALQKA